MYLTQSVLRQRCAPEWTRSSIFQGTNNWIEMLARYTLLARLKRRSRNSGIVNTFERR